MFIMVEELVGRLGAGGMYGNFVLSVQFCCEPKTALKNEVIIKNMYTILNF